jgi:hypothetical protein
MGLKFFPESPNTYKTHDGESQILKSVRNTMGKFTICIDVSAEITRRLCGPTCSLVLDHDEPQTPAFVAAAIVKSFQTIAQQIQNPECIVVLMCDRKAPQKTHKIRNSTKKRVELETPEDMNIFAVPQDTQDQYEIEPDESIPDKLSTMFGTWPDATLTACPDVWTLCSNFPVVRAVVTRAVMKAIGLYIQETNGSVHIKKGAFVVNVPSLPLQRAGELATKKPKTLSQAPEPVSVTQAQQLALEFLKNSVSPKQERPTTFVECAPFSEMCKKNGAQGFTHVSFVKDGEISAWALPTDETPFLGEADITLFNAKDAVAAHVNFDSFHTEIYETIDSDAIATCCLRNALSTLDEPRCTFVLRHLRSGTKVCEIVATNNTLNETVAEVSAAACMGTDYIGKSCFFQTHLKSPAKFVKDSVQWVSKQARCNPSFAIIKNGVPVTEHITEMIEHASSQSDQRKAKKGEFLDISVLAQLVSTFVQYMAPKHTNNYRSD